MRRRRAAVAGLVAIWFAAFAIWSVPSTTAVPASAPAALAEGAFQPVIVPLARSAGPSPAGADSVSASVAATLGPIVEVGAPPVPSARPRVRLPAAVAGVVRKAPPPPVTHHALRGNASWYCKAGVSICMAAHPDRAGVADLYAAAGPRLRRAICGSDTSNCWRGRRVVVDGVVVVLADWCQCYKGQANEKIIDLYWDAWVRVPGVENGLTVRW